MQNIEVQNRQALIDIAMQHTGSVEGLVPLCLDNDMSASETLINGATLKHPGVRNKYAARCFANEKIMPVSNPGTVPEGIGYWNVAMDFKVNDNG
jgi:hypothetical protein